MDKGPGNTERVEPLPTDEFVWALRQSWRIQASYARTAIMEFLQEFLMATGVKFDHDKTELLCQTVRFVYNAIYGIIMRSDYLPRPEQSIQVTFLAMPIDVAAFKTENAVKLGDIYVTFQKMPRTDNTVGTVKFTVELFGARS